MKEKRRVNTFLCCSTLFAFFPPEVGSSDGEDGENDFGNYDNDNCAAPVEPLPQEKLSVDATKQETLETDPAPLKNQTQLLLTQMYFDLGISEEAAKTLTKFMLQADKEDLKGYDFRKSKNDIYEHLPPGMVSVQFLFSFNLHFF